MTKNKVVKGETKKIGYVYILASPNHECLKIGGSDYPPQKRVRQINTTEPYKAHGPWHLIDFVQVSDWRQVEYHLHYVFKSRLNKTVKQQKELFHISSKEVTDHLSQIDPEFILHKPKVDRMFMDKAFLGYLVKLFVFTGLKHWLDMQGAWTFTLFPGTSGGRYFTLNIGRHEVAFSTLPKNGEKQINMILVDQLIFDFPQTVQWVKKNNGVLQSDVYSSAMPRAVSVLFEGDFERAKEFFKLDGVRRALIAYWNEALISMGEQNISSVYSRFHNANAIAKIIHHIEKIDILDQIKV